MLVGLTGYFHPLVTELGLRKIHHLLDPNLLRPQRIADHNHITILQPLQSVIFSELSPEILPPLKNLPGVRSSPVGNGNNQARNSVGVRPDARGINRRDPPSIHFQKPGHAGP